MENCTFQLPCWWALVWLIVQWNVSKNDSVTSKMSPWKAVTRGPILQGTIWSRPPGIDPWTKSKTWYCWVTDIWESFIPAQLSPSWLAPLKRNYRTDMSKNWMSNFHEARCNKWPVSGIQSLRLPLRGRVWGRRNERPESIVRVNRT